MSPKRKAKQLQAQIDDLYAQLDAHAEQIAALIMKDSEPAPRARSGRTVSRETSSEPTE